MVLKLFPDLIPLLKVDHFEGFLNRIKIDGMVNTIIGVAVTCKNSGKYH